MNRQPSRPGQQLAFKVATANVWAWKNDVALWTLEVQAEVARLPGKDKGSLSDGLYCEDLLLTSNPRICEPQKILGPDLEGCLRLIYTSTWPLAFLQSLLHLWLMELNGLSKALFSRSSSSSFYFAKAEKRPAPHSQVNMIQGKKAMGGSL